MMHLFLKIRGLLKRTAFLCLFCLCVLLLPTAAKAASNLYLSPGSYNVSSYTKATNLYLYESGTYTLTGSSNVVMVHVGKTSADITVVLNGLTLKPDGAAPGVSFCDRSAITVNDVSDLRVTLQIPAGTTTELYGYKSLPALCKTGLNTTLTINGTGTLIAKAHDDGYRTAGIGSAGSKGSLIHVNDHIFGNVTFQDVTVEAYGTISSGSHFDGTSGVGIGASWPGKVDGIHFVDSTIYACAGGADAAGIGTPAGSTLSTPWIFVMPAKIDIPCENISIDRSTINLAYTRYDSTKQMGGAAIGGGMNCSATNIAISNSAVYTKGQRNVSSAETRWGTGIGGGSNGNGTNINIQNSMVDVCGYYTGIGGGYAYIGIDDDTTYGDCHVNIESGTITAKGLYGVGIGGWAGKTSAVYGGKKGKGTVQISGGTVTAIGGDGCGIGGGGSGCLSNIAISGGYVVAQSNTLNAGRDLFHPIGVSSGSISKATLKNITISGGTVIATTDQLCGELYADAIYISGGNVYATASGTVYMYQGGPEVVRKDIRLERWENPLFVPWEQNAVHSLTLSGTAHSYGIKDMTGYNDLFYLWLEKDHAVVEGIQLNSSVITHNQIPVSTFTGYVDQSSGILYPPILANIKDGGMVQSSYALPYYSVGLPNFTPLAKAGYVVDYYQDTYNAKVMDSMGNFTQSMYTTTVAPYLWTTAKKTLFDSGITFYPVWKETQYTIAFDANAPSATVNDVEGSKPTQIKKYTEDIDLSGGFSLKGYTLTGWNTQADGKGTTYPTTTTTPQTLKADPNQETVLYAVWEPLTYEVTFVNGSVTKTQTFTYDAMETLPTSSALGFTPASDQMFIGWEKLYVLGTHLYFEGDFVCNLCTFDDATGVINGETLEAVWIDKSNCTIVVTNDEKPVTGLKNSLVLRNQWGTEYTNIFCDTAAEGVYQENDDPLSGNVVANDTYMLSIAGYDTDNYTVTIDDANRIYYLDFYTVKFELDPNDAKVATMKVDGGDEGTTFTKEKVIEGRSFSIEILPNPGYRFESYTATGIQPVWEQSQATNPNRLTVKGQSLITAHVDEVSYKVAFDSNGDNVLGTMTNQDMRYSEPQTLHENNYTRKGYLFDGWNTMANGTGTRYENQQSVKDLTTQDEGVFSLYAQWKPISYTICFDANNGFGTMADMTCFYDQTTTLNQNQFALLGYQFLFWNTDPAGGATILNDGASFQNLTATNDETITLYAQWHDLSYGPWIYTHPQDVTIQEGQQASFTIVAGGQDLTYQWQRLVDATWQNIDAETSHTYTLLNATVQNDNSATFRCLVTDIKGTLLTSNEAVLTVQSIDFPQTGDQNHLFRYSILALLGLLGFFVLIITCKRANLR